VAAAGQDPFRRSPPPIGEDVVEHFAEGFPMLRRICLLAASVALLTACAAGGSTSNSYFSCDRNGDREQRAAC
jgi:hypothetical protein